MLFNQKSITSWTYHKIVKNLELDENNHINQYKEASRKRLVIENAIEILEEGQFIFLTRKSYK